MKKSCDFDGVKRTESMLRDNAYKKGDQIKVRKRERHDWGDVIGSALPLAAMALLKKGGKVEKKSKGGSCNKPTHKVKVEGSSKATVKVKRGRYANGSVGKIRLEQY